MFGTIYETSLFNFLMVTVLMGGAAAWMAGRAAALTWSSYWVLAFYIVLLAAAVRFIHKAPLGGTLLSLHYYLVDLAVVAFFGLLAHRTTRTQQMTSRYRWLFEKVGPFAWRGRAPG